MTEQKKPMSQNPFPPPADPSGTSSDSLGQASQGKAPHSVQDLEKQVARLTDIAGRAQADLQNFKMRMERDAHELRFFMQSGFLLKILPVLDDLHRAMSHLSSKDGLEQIAKKLEKILSDAGAKKIEAIGTPFDPQRHEVVNSGLGEKDTVLAVHEEGYELHGKVLRPAKVQVGDGRKSA